MSQTCPDCGSRDSLSFIAEAGQKVCSNCGTVAHDLQVYEPTTFHELAYALGATPERRHRSSDFPGPVGPSGRYFWSSDLEESRRLNQVLRKPEVDARIQGTLSTLAHPGLFEQVDFLFQRARDESWKTPKLASVKRGASVQDESLSGADASSSTYLPSSLVVRRVRWGNDSLLLATACCYAVLRREGIRVDLQTVSDAAQLPFLKVKRAFKLLKLLVADAIRNIRLANPDPYIHRIVAFFHFLNSRTGSVKVSVKVAKILQPLRSTSASTTSAINTDPSRILSNTPFEAVEATALDLCKLWWPNRISSTQSPPQLAAFAIVILAIEANVKAPAPILEMFRYTRQALEFDPTLVRSQSTLGPQLTTDDPSSKNAIEYYKELCQAVRLEASKIPWLTDLTPIPQQGRAKKRSALPRSVDSSLAGMTDLARRDLIVHALDVLDVWRNLASNRPEVADIQPACLHQPPTTALGEEEASSRCMKDREERDASELEVDVDEFTCFGSDVQYQSLAGSPGRSHIDDESLLEEDGDGEAWPRIQTRLQASGILDSPANSEGVGSQQHPIDLLTDDQVDQILFDTDELAPIFRTDPAELAAFERAKVAAGDWPAKSEHERNAEFAAFARSVVRDQSPARQKKRKDSAASPVAETSSNPSKGGQIRKRQLQTSSLSKSKKRSRLPSKLSLEEQLEESDWSD
ncbi:uncharacterized protein UTRI_06278_B [Ustilago trichophora]|uniref:TFIIB-type domain-containing protein n=1 Tax=Ustilago trichophora TaxID=86804 RepID=A0A5C3EHU4_9BASI|nr:uncharacterized protein UTRI_06278_B [Ustilago trichophora]